MGVHSVLAHGGHQGCPGVRARPAGGGPPLEPGQVAGEPGQVAGDLATLFARDGKETDTAVLKRLRIAYTGGVSKRTFAGLIEREMEGVRGFAWGRC